MNEEVSAQLHAGLISITDTHQDHLYQCDVRLEALESDNAELRKGIIGLSKALADVQMQSVMCHAMLMHYAESHLEPMGRLFAQIGALSDCGIVPPTGACSCDVVDEPFNSQGADGPGTPSSLPSLESISSPIIPGSSPSPIDSVYYTPAFLQSLSGSASFTPPEVVPFVPQRGSPLSPPTLSPSFPGDTGSFGFVIEGEGEGGVFEDGSPGIPLLGDEGWSSGGSGGDAVGSFAGRDRVGAQCVRLLLLRGGGWSLCIL